MFVAAVAAFAMATLSKGMTLTLPVVLLACAWWQRGRIQRRDLLRVVPYLLIGSLMVGMEVYHQHLAVSDQSVVRSDGFLSRTAVAGCAVWFYLWKLIWPVHLAFIYRRWDLAAVGGLWFAPGLLLAAIFALAWRWRRSWGRPVLMAAVCYVALLLPALGLVNVAFMEFSLVADHWQYAAMIVPCAALAGTVGAALSRRPWSRLPGAGLCLALLATLAVLTWRQSGTYAGVETLYRTTIARNPDCWMAHNNLGLALAARRRGNEAIEQYREALKLWPGYAQAHFNLANELGQCGRVDEAVEHYQRALELDPKYPAAHVGLGLVLARRGHLDEATAHFRKALAINPDVADAHSNLGLALEHYGRTEEAIGHYRRALEIDPRYLPARINLGLALARSGRMDEAIEHYQRALRMKPGDAKVHYALGLALVSSGRPDAAVAQFQRALKIDPGNAKVHYGLGFALAACQRLDEAIEHYQRAVELDPRYAEAHNDLGTALARCGRIDEAVAHFRRALEISPQSVEAHNNLGLALAGCGRTAEAIEHYRKALALAQQQNKADMAANLEGKLRLYQPETPAREPPHPSQ